MKPLNIRNRVLLLSLPFLMAWLVACSPHKYPRAFIVADSLMEEQPDSAMLLLDSLRQPMSQSRSKKDRMYYELLRLKAADKAGSLEADGKKADSILHYYEHGGDRRLLPTAYYYAARTYYEQKDAPQALEYFQKAAEVVGDDWELEGCIYSNMGYIFMYQGLYDEMKKAFVKMYEVSLLAQDTLGMIYGLRDIAVSYEADNKHVEALSYLKKAYGLVKKSNMDAMKLNIELSLSAQYMYLGDYRKARYYAQAPLEHIHQIDSSAVYSLHATIHKYLGNEDSLLYYAKKMEQFGHLHAKDSAYKFMTKIYLHRGNSDEANKYYEKYLTMDDSVRRVTRIESTARVNALYNYQLREKENTLLKRSNEKKKQLIISLTTCAAIAIFLLIVYQIRLKRKHAKETLMLKYAEHLKDKKLRESQTLVDDVHQRMKQLESELELERQKLLSSDGLSHSPERLNAEEVSIRNSSIYQRLMDMSKDDSMSRPKDDDWEQLEQLLTSVYDKFPLKLKVVCNLSKRDYRMCLLIKMGMTPQRISNIFSIERSSVASQRARLFKEHFGRKGGAKDWDSFILSL